MKVLVTGGAGFIGSHIVDALLKRRADVRVLDNLYTGHLENLTNVRKKIELIQGDIRDSRAVRRALKGVAVVYHQAALRSVPKSISLPLEYNEVNVGGTLLLLKESVRAGARRFILASSSSVYGDVTLPQKETCYPAPQSPYAVSKLSGEFCCSMFYRLHGIEAVSLRYFNVFGPRQSLESQYAVVVPKFIVSLMNRKPPPIFGDGKQTRDFTYVENVVEANLRAGSARGVGGKVFNVATGKRHSVLELAQLVSKITGIHIAPTLKPTRAGDMKHSWADITQIKRLLGFKVKVPFKAGVVRTTEWFQAHAGASARR